MRGALQNFHGSFPFLYRLIPPRPPRLAAVPSVRPQSAHLGLPPLPLPRAELGIDLVPLSHRSHRIVKSHLCFNFTLGASASGLSSWLLRTFPDFLLMIWAFIPSQNSVTILVFKVGCRIMNLVGRLIAPVSTDFSLGALPSHPSNWRSNCIPCIGDSDGGVDLNLDWKEGAAPPQTIFLCRSMYLADKLLSHQYYHPKVIQEDSNPVSNPDIPEPSHPMYRNSLPAMLLWVPSYLPPTISSTGDGLHPGHPLPITNIIRVASASN